ncbi:MAG: hypothetical protein OEM52_06140 [bacterium]|nr:hypothetical protein [bacterium]
MKRIISILLSAMLVIIALSAFAADTDDKAAPSPRTPLTVKEKVELAQERLLKMETKLNADIELSKDAIASAKKELESAKKLLAQGKEQEAEEALVKSRHHARRLSLLGPGPKGRGGRGHGPRMGGPGMGNFPDCPMGAPRMGIDGERPGFGPRWKDR